MINIIVLPSGRQFFEGRKVLPGTETIGIERGFELFLRNPKNFKMAMNISKYGGMLALWKNKLLLFFMAFSHEEKPVRMKRDVTACPPAVTIYIYQEVQ